MNYSKNSFKLSLVFLLITVLFITSGCSKEDKDVQGRFSNLTANKKVNLTVNSVGYDKTQASFFAEYCVKNESMSNVELEFYVEDSASKQTSYKVSDATKVESGTCRKLYSNNISSFGVTETSQYKLTAKVDPANLVAEQSESDNSKTYTNPGINLSLKSTGYDGTQASFFGEYCVENNAISKVELEFKVGESVYKTTDSTTVEAGSCKKLYSNSISNFGVKTTSTYELVTTVDPANLILENNESDNSKTYANGPDLVVQEIGLTSDKKIYFIVANIGNLDIDPTTYGSTRYYDNDDSVGIYSWQLLSDKEFLKAGKSTKTVTNLTLTDGLEHSIKVFIDSESIVIESNEINNESTVKLK